MAIFGFLTTKNQKIHQNGVFKMELKSKNSLQKMLNIKKCAQMRIILDIGDETRHNLATFL